ncbi:MAG: hypothetical protein NUV46_00925 [Nanoarchaeota archaeon]|nr:hypothetical protein [Nanoarchaeota archaeon]
MSSKPEKLTAMMIIEVLGRPKEHLVETLEDLSMKVNSEKGLKILNKKINEPNLVKDQKDLFTAFVELEFEVEEVNTLAMILFKYMPSHIEVLEPENFVFKNFEFNELFNEIVRRLHRYEELVRVLQFQLEKEKNDKEKK